MSQHDDQVYLKHMRDYAREAVDMLAGKTQTDLAQNWCLEHSVIPVALLPHKYDEM